MNDSLLQYSRKARETMQQFSTRLAKALPNFPAEVLKQWLIESSGVLRHFDWLEPTRASFAKEEWTTDLILGEVKHWYENAVEQEVAKFLEQEAYRDSHRVSTFMRTKGTWPVAPIIFDNALLEPIQFGGGSPRFVMLEGAHRLAFLRGMRRLDQERLLQKHSVWLMRMDPIV